MADLKYNPYDYLNTQELKYSTRYSDKELRRVYSYLRGIASKRIARLEQAGFTSGAQYQRLKALGLPYVKDIRSRSELASRLEQTAFFVSLKQSTLSGIKRVRAQKVKQFQDMGLKIKPAQLDDFLGFFEKVKTLLDGRYLINQVIDIYNAGLREKITPDRMFENYKKLTGSE